MSTTYYTIVGSAFCLGRQLSNDRCKTTIYWSRSQCGEKQPTKNYIKHTWTFETDGEYLLT